MDFIPAGYITTRTAVDLILRKRHGEDWGQKELQLEKVSAPVPGAIDDNGQAVEGQYYDREAIKDGRLQTREAEEELLAALRRSELTANIEDGPPVPIDYWSSGGAMTTVRTGILELGSAAPPMDLKWHHNRVLFSSDLYDDWLSDAPDPVTSRRRHDPGKDVDLQNKIETVLVMARRMQSKAGTKHGRNQLARLLADNKRTSGVGYSEETIRKILNGSYRVSQRLGISGLPGIDPRAI